MTFYGCKAETTSKTPAILRSNPPALAPVWLYIRGSSNITLVGYEGNAETAAGRGLVEISGSTGVTLTSLGRRGNGLQPTNAEVRQDQWYFVKELTASGANTVTAQGFLSLFKSQAP